VEASAAAASVAFPVLDVKGRAPLFASRTFEILLGFYVYYYYLLFIIYYF
jgi:hypothetical protein